MSDTMLTRDEFCEVIEELVIAHKASDAIRESIRSMAKPAGNEMLQDFLDPVVLFSGHETTLVKVLSRMFDDKDAFIEWWLWECGYGTDTTLLDSVCDTNGEPVPMRTAGDLYDYLIRRMA